MTQCALFLALFVSTSLAIFIVLRMYSLLPRYSWIEWKKNYAMFFNHRKYSLALSSIILFVCLSFNFSYLTKSSYAAHGEISILGQRMAYSYCDKDKKENKQDDSSSEDDEEEFVIAAMPKGLCFGV